MLVAGAADRDVHGSPLVNVSAALNGVQLSPSTNVSSQYGEGTQATLALWPAESWRAFDVPSSVALEGNNTVQLNISGGQAGEPGYTLTHNAAVGGDGKRWRLPAPFEPHSTVSSPINIQCIASLLCMCVCARARVCVCVCVCVCRLRLLQLLGAGERIIAACRFLVRMRAPVRSRPTLQRHASLSRSLSLSRALSLSPPHPTPSSHTHSVCVCTAKASTTRHNSVLHCMSCWLTPTPA